MLHGNQRKIIAAVLICVSLLPAMTHSVLAAEPHEDPEITKPAFSGISLLRYYSGSLDFILQKNPTEVEARLEKMPFANILQSLEEPADDFTTSSINISYTLVTIDKDISRLRTLIEQSRLKEIKELAIEIFVGLSQANDELKQLEQAIITTGKELHVSSAPEQSALRRYYNEVLEKISRIKEMFVLYNDLLVGLLPGSEKLEELLESVELLPVELLESAELTLIQKPKPVDITLKELLRSEEYILVKTLDPRDTTLNDLLRSENIDMSELLELVDIEVFQELIPTDTTLAELLKIVDISLIKELRPTDISLEELLTTEGFILVETPELIEISVTEILKATDIALIEALKPTGITLEVQSTVAFVGDNIRFEGVLTSEGKPLVGREVHILLNSSRYVTVKTDAEGHYWGTLQVPYWYIHEMDVQALYYPQDEDRGIYLASLRQVIKVKVLFYEAELEVTVEDKAYPGLETTVTGGFDYGQSPPLNERKAEIYFDDVLITEVVAGEAFTQEIQLDPQTRVGEHSITVSSAETGSYSSVATSVILNVTRATPILDLDLPKVAMIPGSIGLEGKLYSELGPLNEASMRMQMGESQVELVSSKDGTFDAKIKAGLGFGLIGLQDLVIQVLPQEPWHAPLNATSSVLVVNVVNSGAFVAILVFLGIYLPGRFKRRLGIYTRRRVRQEIPTASPELAPVYTDMVTTPTVTKENKEITGEPRDRILYWYRLVVRLLQRITKTLLGPQQTLREFAKESGRIVKPVAKYIFNFTKMVERLLYSQYRPTEKDVENSRKLSNKIEDETKPMVTTEPVVPGIISMEEVQFAPKEVSAGSVARAFDSRGKDSMTVPWRQTSTWLWVLLVMVVAYYAFILLFVLPLLLVSFAFYFPVLVIDDSGKTGTKTVPEEEPTGESI